MKQDFLIILTSAIVILITLIFFWFKSAGRTEETSQSIASCKTKDFTGEINFFERQAYFEGDVIDIPSLAYEDSGGPVLGASNEERWIEVDLSEQKLKAWEGNKLFLETLVSTGLPRTPTPQGEFRIWIKLKYAKMEGGSGRYYYYLPNVPFVMYFGNDRVPNWKGYGLHGTYWHNDFGRPRSHGCVNLPIPVAEKLYYWISPNLPEGRKSVYASPDNPGTRVVIHE